MDNYCPKTLKFAFLRAALRPRQITYFREPSMNNFWRSCLDHFEKQLPPQQFKTWIKPLKFHAVDHKVTLTAPNRFVLQWIRDRFLG